MRDITGFIPTAKQAKWIDYMLRGYGLADGKGEFNKSEREEMDELVELEIVSRGKNHSGTDSGMYHIEEECKPRASDCLLKRDLNETDNSEESIHYVDLLDSTTEESVKVPIRVRDRQGFGRYVAVYLKPNNRYVCGTTGKNLMEALYNVKKQLIALNYYKKPKS